MPQPSARLVTYLLLLAQLLSPLSPVFGTTERRGYYGLSGNWDARPSMGLRNYGNLWRVRLTHNANNLALFDLAWAYDYAGNVTRSNEAVTGANGVRSEVILTGKKAFLKFETPGTYDYICGLHPSMKGKIEVK